MNSNKIDKENIFKILTQLKRESKKFKYEQDSIKNKSKSTSSFSLYNINDQQFWDDQQEMNYTEQTQLNSQQSFLQVDSKITNIEEHNYPLMLKYAYYYLKWVYMIQCGIKSEEQIDELIESNDISQYYLTREIQKKAQCKHLAFNKNDTLIAITQNNEIEILKFNSEITDKIAQLKGHVNDVNFSAGEQIFMWVESSYDKWETRFNIYANSPINCMTFNKAENLLITGNQQGFIQAYKLDFIRGQIFLINEIKKSQNFVYQVSFNKSENRLVACTKDELILILNIGYDGGLTMFKLIKRNKFACRIIFLDDERILLAQRQALIELQLQNDTIQETIIQETDSDKDWYQFPIQYNQAQDVIVIKQNKYIYIIKELNKGNYLLQQKLDFDSIELFGTISNCGIYLITWNNQKLQTYMLLK
ncbi:unnamed protein product [Paramecium pentaurelia]|uniref:WD40-repeat-containing domain n=1 Tax=Paramecium pentaurelia TaxID=43138 RepID=A0A8S1WI20_9CILI|nr:unnamed protein product [Paramecium pentaurelia]